MLDGAYGFDVIRRGDTVVSGEIENTILTAGWRLAWDCLFSTQTPSNNWYIGLTDMGSPGGTSSTTEFVGYDEATRPEWISSTVSIGDHRAYDLEAPEISLRQDAEEFAVFTITTTGYVGRPFLINDSTKGGTVGTIFSRGNNTNVEGLNTSRVMDAGVVTQVRNNIIVWPGDQIRLSYIIKDYGQGTFLSGTKLLLDRMFKGATKPNTWYLGLINHDFLISDTDTPAVLPTAEFTGYAGNRPVIEDPLSFITSIIHDDYSRTINYYITETGSIGGTFVIADAPTPGSTSGTLFTFMFFEGVRDYSRFHQFEYDFSIPSAIPVFRGEYHKFLNGVFT